MSQSNPNIALLSENSDMHRKSDEIDLLSLLQTILKTWKVWLISLVIVSILFGAVQALKILIHSPTETLYSKPIRLTFPNAHKLVFPSGAKLTYGDIVAPAVIQQAFERNDLARFDLTVADLQGGLSATPYAPTYPLIIERYNKLMADKKLTPSHIAELQEKLQKELEQATTGEILISWRLEGKFVPKEVALKVLNDIPAIWAEQAIKEKGVLEIKATLATAKSLNKELILNEEVLVAGDILAEKIDLLRANVRELSSFEGAQTITDPQTHMRLADLTNAINDLNQYVVRNFTAPIRLQGLTNTPALSSFYYQDKLNSLQIRHASLQSQAAAIRESLQSYNNSDQQGSIVGERTSSPAIMTQLNSDMLDKLVSLSSDADREKYKQRLNTQWLNLIKEIANTESAITETKNVLTAIEKAATQPLKSEQAFAQYLTRAKTGLPEILQQLTDYFAVSERIAKQLRAETIGIKEHLYVPVTNTILESKSVFDIKGAIIIWIALLFLTSVIVIPVCMIRNALKQR